MKLGSFGRAALAGAGVAMLALVLAFALRPSGEPAAPDFDPTKVAGRPDLDVPYVSSEHEVVTAMLEMAEVGPDDFVVDLGSGDGRILIAAARDRGARGLGVDIDPARIRDSIANARAAGVSERVEFRRADLFRTPLAQADVLTLYLLPEVNLRLRRRILAEMRPGTRVVSNMFDMGGWRWDGRRSVGSATVYLWIVPARVAGGWTLRAGGRTVRLNLSQRFQEVAGNLVFPDGRIAPVESGRVDGARLRFVADLGDGRRLYEGRVEGDSIVPAGGEPSLPVPAAAGWRAERSG